MTTVSVHEAKTHLSSLVSIIERKGGKIIICRHGKAVAELGPVSTKSRIRTNPTLKKIRILSDPTESTVKEWERV